MTEIFTQSMAAVFLNQADKYGDRPCITHKENGRYKSISWRRMGEMVGHLGSFLISRGIGKGDHIAIFSPNRYEWWLTDLAVLSVGAADVPIYATNSSEEAFYVLNHSESRACFVGGTDNFEKILKIKNRLTHLEFIVCYDSETTGKDGAIPFSDALGVGRNRFNKDAFKTRLNAVNAAEPATLLYTSGATGNPKGVMLSHHNMISNIRQILADYGKILSEKDQFISFLPLSHALERTAGFYLPVSIGATVAFAESFAALQQNMAEVRPTVIISVPRLYEKVREGILSQINQASAVRKTVFNWAVRTGRKNLPYVCKQGRRTRWFALQYGLADRLVFSKIKAALGMECLKLAVSGGAPLSVFDAEFFLGMGIMILEGYGLTETSPVTHANRPGLIKPGTVGPPLKDTAVRFSDQGEILIKGPQVMLGYYKDTRATRESFTEDGYLMSGDMGQTDEDGYLSIIGRKKDIIITSGGKNIAPQPIELRLQNSALIARACLIGDRRRFVSALIVPEFDELERWAGKNGIVFSDHEDLIQNRNVLERYQEEVNQCMLPLSQAEKIKKFRLLSCGWAQHTGELTPTLKLKRRAVEEKYGALIEDMYRES